MIDQQPAVKKVVASARPMRQLSPMRKAWPSVLLAFLVGGCSLPAPYQTYTPDQLPPPNAPTNPIVVYGATTTTPDMAPSGTGLEPLPAPPGAASTSDMSLPPASSGNRVAICYNRLWHDPDAVKNAAAQACGGAPAPRVISQGVDLDACPLLTPTKALFACTASSTP